MEGAKPLYSSIGLKKKPYWVKFESQLIMKRFGDLYLKLIFTGSERKKKLWKKNAEFLRKLCLDDIRKISREKMIKESEIGEFEKIFGAE